MASIKLETLIEEIKNQFGSSGTFDFFFCSNFIWFNYFNIFDYFFLVFLNVNCVIIKSINKVNLKIVATEKGKYFIREAKIDILTDQGKL